MNDTQRISLPFKVTLGNTSISQDESKDDKGNIKHCRIVKTEINNVKFILNDSNIALSLLLDGAAIRYRLYLKRMYDAAGKVDGQKWLDAYAKEDKHTVKVTQLVGKVQRDPVEVAKEQVAQVLKPGMNDAQAMAALKKAGLL